MSSRFSDHGRPPFNASTKVDVKPSSRGRSRTPPTGARQVHRYRSQSGGASRMADYGNVHSSGYGQQHYTNHHHPQQHHPHHAGGYAEQHQRSTSVQQQQHYAPTPSSYRGGGNNHADPSSEVAELRGMLTEVMQVTKSLAMQQHPPPPTAAAPQQQYPQHSQQQRISMSPEQQRHHAQPNQQPPQQQAPSQGTSPPTQRQQPTLKQAEIERIVKRVESHFVAKLQESQEVADQQSALIRQLRAQLAAQKTTYEERIDEYEKRIASAVDYDAMLNEKNASSSPNTPKTATGSGSAGGLNGNNVAATVAVEQLKQLLHFEKRQRMQCEEQSQLLAEQHNKVVSTLEQRLRKQEKQIQELMGASGASSNASFSVRQTPRSARIAGLTGGGGTGRRNGGGASTMDDQGSYQGQERSTPSGGYLDGIASTNSPMLSSAAPPSAFSTSAHQPPAAVPPIKGLPTTNSEQSTPSRQTQQRPSALMDLGSGSGVDRSDSKQSVDMFNVAVSNNDMMSTTTAGGGGGGGRSSGAAYLAAGRKPHEDDVAMNGLPRGLTASGAAAFTSSTGAMADENTVDAYKTADDVADFLDNITKELDSINAAETERNAAINRLI